jgi:hypothetical protein
MAGIGEPPLGQVIRKELGTLIKTTQFFGKFNEQVTELPQLKFGEAIRDMNRVAPNWVAFLSQLVLNDRSTWDSFQGRKSVDSTLLKRMIHITSIICNSRAALRSNFVPALLDIYLLGSGTKRRVIEVLSGLGICHSYHTANGWINRIAQHAKVRSVYN